MENTWDMWVAADGSYGTSAIALIDTSSFTDEDWETFDENPWFLAKQQGKVIR